MNIISRKIKGNIEIVVRDKIKNKSKTITIETKKTIEQLKTKIEKVLE